MERAKFSCLSEQNEGKLAHHPFAEDALLTDVEGVFCHRDVVEQVVARTCRCPSGTKDNGDNIHFVIATIFGRLHSPQSVSSSTSGAHVPVGERIRTVGVESHRCGRPRRTEVGFCLLVLSSF